MPFVETSSMYEIAEADLGRSRSSPGADPEIKDDPGEIKEGQYRIEGDLLRVEDKEGRPLGRARLRPGDEPRLRPAKSYVRVTAVMALSTIRFIVRTWELCSGPTAGNLPHQCPLWSALRTDCGHHPRSEKCHVWTAPAMQEKNQTFPRIVRVQPCIRPLNAAVLAAGPDVIR